MPDFGLPVPSTQVDPTMARSAMDRAGAARQSQTQLAGASIEAAMRGRGQDIEAQLAREGMAQQEMAQLRELWAEDRRAADMIQQDMRAEQFNRWQVRFQAKSNEKLQSLQQDFERERDSLMREDIEKTIDTFKEERQRKAEWQQFINGLTLESILAQTKGQQGMLRTAAALNREKVRIEQQYNHGLNVIEANKRIIGQGALTDSLFDPGVIAQELVPGRDYPGFVRGQINETFNNVGLPNVTIQKLMDPREFKRLRLGGMDYIKALQVLEHYQSEFRNKSGTFDEWAPRNGKMFARRNLDYALKDITSTLMRTRNQAVDDPNLASALNLLEGGGLGRLFYNLEQQYGPELESQREGLRSALSDIIERAGGLAEEYADVDDGQFTDYMIRIQPMIRGFFQGGTVPDREGE